ncbi:2,4-dihydroxyhept-2-ene-1,7-dioic acid aldolase [Aliidongia dinghuensis]|uniref:2,4-dihydroxyhept-2-ene-1,7-dioic acid aldolase n=1 Tax=Aliidongia dinghuensis TaxID=1867774 RepID=A0A8J2YXC0_9PROT|nr:HpcH/HpaI aldolase/citrate lyase family protein [Aliidongia dinghuensis]GGF35536.1 2,4-dihydroxyhept-2-ene-1,7-dioic acid aldolase [Aliidongia dinghuensis]
MRVPENRFKRALAQGERQIGLWSTLGSAAVAELIAHAGYDWVLIDTEHSPNEPPAIAAQLQAMQGGTASAVVRPAWNDPVLIKRILDLGVQSLLIPFVETAEAAERAVAATRYPPHGIRGVSTGSRAAGYGRIKDYVTTAGAEICVLVQIETMKGVENIEAIAAVPGVDGVFVGPADLSASLGHLGNPQNPEVQDTIARVLAACERAGKPTGYLTGNEAEARKWLDAGFRFVAVGTDNGVLVKAVDELRARFR